MITILDVALAEGAKADATGAITADEFDARGLPFFSGCEGCGASLAPYNAFPSLSGRIRCRDCIGDAGFETTAAFLAWEVA